jgi:DNA-binding transcriptional regulator of glucitol operon
VTRAYRFAGRPAWLGGHLLVLAAVVTMVLLGHWQLDVSERKGFSLQNFGYALQWWAFSLFALLLWGKILRDHSRPVTDVPSAESAQPVAEPITYRRYVMPQSSDGPPEPVDEVHAAYNAYLQSLAESE